MKIQNGDFKFFNNLGLLHQLHNKEGFGPENEFDFLNNDFDIQILNNDFKIENDFEVRNKL